MGKVYFQPALLDFLRELARHNDRDWFHENKARYERDVRDPMLAFIRDVERPLHALSKRFVVDARPVGGSMFRIYRDTRFSADKSPYKTHVAAHFPHERCEGSAPGFYIRLAPGESMAGAGIWHPEPDALGHIRDAIVANGADWKKSTKGLALGGESLKRPPRGFDAEHPLIDDIRRKDFVASGELSDRQVCGADFLDRFLDRCRATAPLVRFLTRALDLPY